MCETKNENSSNLLRGISENGGILFYGIDSTAVVRRMEQLHKTSAVTTAALGLPADRCCHDGPDAQIGF